MAILNNSNAIETSGGYNINNSIRLRSSASASLSRTFTTPTNNRKWTMSFWFKRGALGVGQEIFAKGNTSTQPWTLFYIDANGALNIYEYSTGGTLPNFNLSTNAVFRDPSAWYHIVVAVDTTLSTAVDRQKIYVNGTQQTFSSSSYYPQNTDTQWNSSGGTSYIGRQGGGDYLDAYLADVNFVDGSQLTPSSFGETDTTTGVWKPKAYTGTYGTNGFYLKFSDIATTSGSNAGLGKDFSGNSNYWTTNNISITAGTTYDSMTDVPTLTSATAANFAVLNPLAKAADATLSNANLTIAYGSGSSTSTPATMSVSSGKWYYEFVCTTSSINPVAPVVGVQASSMPTSEFPGYGDANAWGMYLSDGNKFNNNTSGGVSYGSSFAVNDIMMCAFDLDNGKIWWGKNGTWFASGNPASGTNAAFTNLTGSLFPAIGDGSGSQTFTGSFNFGQRPFSYTPPTGFVALNTYNLPTSTIVKGNQYMDAYLRTGTGGTVTISGLNFYPDFVWSKGRSVAYSHHLNDSNRGANKDLSSNSTSAESVSSANGYLSAFASAGYTLSAGSSDNNNFNQTSATYVDWLWNAGSGSTSSNTSGSITSTVSVNASAGFSVITFTAPASGNWTIGHGLGVAPSFVITKSRSAGGWIIYHSALGNTKWLEFTTGAAQTGTGFPFNSLSPTSTVINYGNSTSWGASSNQVAYCWAEIAGFSKFGSYTGNGSTDGSFVYTGFLSKFILIKASSSAGYNWYIWDTARNTYNVLGEELSPNLSNAAATQTDLDVTSNGFKLRTSASRANGSGITYIYACFASNPFKNSNAF